MAAKRAAKKAPKKSAKKAAKRAKKAAPRKAARSTASPKKPMGRAGKAEGAEEMRKFIAGLPAWQRDIAERVDAIVAREVPEARRAIKWNAPFWGIEGRGWFASFGHFTKHVKVMFFKGTSLKPQPPAGESKEGRGIDLQSADELDEAQMTSWVRQAAAIPGWGK